MKKAYMIRFLAFCLSLLMLSSLTLLIVEAKEAEYIPTEWYMDENAEYLDGNGKRYTRYYVNWAFYGDAQKSFYFANTVEYKGNDCEVYGDSADPHIVSVRKGDGYSFVFVDEEGRKIIEDFLSGRNCIYYLEDFDISYYTVIEEGLAWSLDAEYYDKDAKLVKVEVGSLTEGEIYEVTVHDSLLMKAYQHGAVYVMPNGTVYYLCFEELDNSYFDADGYFSYRSGIVDVWKVEGDLLKYVNEAVLDMQPKRRAFIDEWDVIYGYCDVDGNIIIDEPEYRYFDGTTLFWIFFVLIGFAVPLAVMVMGILLGSSKKLANKYWFVMAAFAALWVLADFGLLLIFLL